MYCKPVTLSLCWKWKASWQWRVKTFDFVTWSSKGMWGLEVDKLGFNCHWTRWPCRVVRYLPEPHYLSWKLRSILIVLGKQHIKFLSGRKYFSSVSTGKFPVRMKKWSSRKWLSCIFPFSLSHFVFFWVLQQLNAMAGLNARGRT